MTWYKISPRYGTTKGEMTKCEYILVLRYWTACMRSCYRGDKKGTQSCYAITPNVSLLLHTRTAHAIDPELRSLLKDVSSAANLIVGVAIETDVEDFWPHKHYHSVADRLNSLELMAKDGISTQGTTTPMIWFQDYPGLIKRMADIGVGRIMLGRLKFTLPGWGAEEARVLDSYWLHVPTEEEALAICAEHKFPGGANTRERFYVSMGGN